MKSFVFSDDLVPRVLSYSFLRSEKVKTLGTRLPTVFANNSDLEIDLESVLVKFCLQWPFSPETRGRNADQEKKISFFLIKTIYVNRAWFSLRLPLKSVLYIFSSTRFQCRPIRGVEFRTLSLNWVFKTWYPCMRCYQVIEFLFCFFVLFPTNQRKKLKRTQKWFSNFVTRNLEL